MDLFNKSNSKAALLYDDECKLFVFTPEILILSDHLRKRSKVLLNFFGESAFTIAWLPISNTVAFGKDPRR